jgi:uncharacterized MAPEG superfamily protein
MSSQLQLLVLAIVIGIINLMWAAVESRRQQGLKWAGGSRDEPRPVTGVAARLERAFANYRETFPLFAAAVIVAYLTGKNGGAALWGSVMYVAARAAYVPLYASGVRYWRSLAWFVGFIGLVVLVIALFL